MHRLGCGLVLFVFAANAQQEPVDRRAFGVLPNNRTVEASQPFAPISSKRKMTIAFKDSFDIPVYPTAAAFAGLYQLENQNPSFGQGASGYAKRFATAYADQMTGNTMTEGIMPSLLHEDPRYFRIGEGSALSRTRYALTRILVTRTDQNHTTFNFAEVGGNATRWQPVMPGIPILAALRTIYRSSQSHSLRMRFQTC